MVSCEGKLLQFNFDHCDIDVLAFGGAGGGTDKTHIQRVFPWGIAFEGADAASLSGTRRRAYGGRIAGRRPLVTSVQRWSAVGGHIKLLAYSDSYIGWTYRERQAGS